ncbi:hypothetical protein CASFOL_012016 [Castilleja foliolosa]|uniref:ER membrane protein complex subunit 6 n=1 Tax=Castilleja foliolosa TaxID=1961234 RepID=A0ABD3DQE2_9LAMI
MAVHEDSTAHNNKSSDGLDEISAFNVENMQNNTRIINYSRTFMSIIGGVIAGILGFTGFTGFVFYFIVMAITTAGLAAKIGFAVHSYFDSCNRIVFDNILSGLLPSTFSNSPNFPRIFCRRLSYLSEESLGPAAIDYRSILQEDEYQRLANSTIHDQLEKLEKLWGLKKSVFFVLVFGTESFTKMEVPRLLIGLYGQILSTRL